MSDFSGKLVVITGAARGIGAATARAFAAQGAKLGLVSRDKAALEALAAETGGIALPCDVADAAALAKAIATAEAAFGPLEILVNNAGMIEPVSALAETDPEAFARAISVNLCGVFNGMRAAMPGMIARGRGTILTVGSGAAHKPYEGWSAYCASKAGAWMLTQSAHLEAGPAGLRILSLSPGTVATDMQRAIKATGINPVSRLEWSDHVPPEWPAKAILWLCGPAGADHAGQELSLRDEGLRRAIGVI